MKVDNSRADAEFDRASRRKTDAARGAEEARPAERVEKSPQGDQVQLSAAVTLVDAATAAAQQAPEVRPEVVARAKVLFDRGEVGRDAGRLADALIDDSSPC